jgi:hypothetical protein
MKKLTKEEAVELIAEVLPSLKMQELYALMQCIGYPHFDGSIVEYDEESGEILHSPS